MVQARQFRKSHPDAHYASALFHYQREFAVKFKSYTTFICVDDKHRAKVGEPGSPVAAAERGRCIIVGLDSSMEVGDHVILHTSASYPPCPSFWTFLNLLKSLGIVARLWLM